GDDDAQWRALPRRKGRRQYRDFVFAGAGYRRGASGPCRKKISDTRARDQQRCCDGRSNPACWEQIEPLLDRLACVPLDNIAHVLASLLCTDEASLQLDTAVDVEPEPDAVDGNTCLCRPTLVPLDATVRKRLAH